MSSNESQGSYERVSIALNRAADHVVETYHSGCILTDGISDDACESMRDAINLVVNATLHYLGNPNDDLGDAIRAMYDADPGDVEAWIVGV